MLRSYLFGASFFIVAWGVYSDRYELMANFEPSVYIAKVKAAFEPRGGSSNSALSQVNDMKNDLLDTMDSLGGQTQGGGSNEGTLPATSAPKSSLPVAVSSSTGSKVYTVDKNASEEKLFKRMQRSGIDTQNIEVFKIN